MLAVALIASNLSAAPPAPLLYEPGVLLTVLALGFLVAILADGIGFFVSLRASTAQEAQELTGVGRFPSCRPQCGAPPDRVA